MTIQNIYRMHQQVYVKTDKLQRAQKITTIAACDDGIVRYKLGNWSNFFYEESLLSTQPTKQQI